VSSAELVQLVRLIVASQSSPGFWTATHVLILLNAILAAGSVSAVVAAIFSIRSSNRVASATEKSVEQERRSISAAIRPIVGDVPLDRSSRTKGTPPTGFIYGMDFDGKMGIEVPFRNIGQGPCFLKNIAVIGADKVTVPAVASVGVLPPLEVGSVSLQLKIGEYGYEAVTNAMIAGEWVVSIFYHDSAGDQRSHTNFTIRHGAYNRSGQWAVDLVELWTCDEDWLDILSSRREVMRMPPGNG
jgi:hypothetical protein